MARDLRTLVVVDLEATCWDGEPPEGQVQEIIEIGICPLDLRTGERLERRSILVKPQLSTVSPFCEQLTTITQEMVDDEGVALAEACKILRREYKVPKRVWVSWGDFDRIQFQRECDLKGLRYPFSPRHINAKTLFALLYGLEREVGMKRALASLELPLEGTHHRGADDAWNIAAIVGEMMGTARGALTG
ncbi:MAG: 3'-5' exonuclease [Myxococcota bacterium]